LKQSERQVSLSALLTQNALVIMLALVLAAGFIWTLFSAFLDDFERQSAEVLVQDKAELLATRLNIYHDIVASLGKSIEVENMLTMQAEVPAAQWAIDNAALLPDMLGLALIKPDGEVLGNPPELRIGAMCLQDMSHQLKGLPTTYPPVHNKLMHLEHFDVTEVLRNSAGDITGLVLGSFKLNTLQSMLDAWAARGLGIQILDQEGNPLLEAGKDSASLNRDIVVTRDVPGSNWRLAVQLPRQNKAALLTSFTATGAVAVGFILLILMLMMNRIRHSIQRDYNEIFTALERVRSGEDLTSDLQPRLQETANIISSAQNIRQQQETLHGLSLTDELTGIPNRRMFNKQLTEYFEQASIGIPVALIMVDLDRFKDLNDSHGHEAGDQVLKLFATLLKQHVRQTDLAARYGGDEFIFIQKDTTAEAIRQWHARLCQHFVEEQERQFPDFSDTRVTCSAGFSFMNPQTDIDANATLKRTDAALYQTKDSAKGDIVEK
jgi:diguanylate cyclase (GGDEF)-like protein